MENIEVPKNKDINTKIINIGICKFKVQFTSLMINKREKRCKNSIFNIFY